MVPYYHKVANLEVIIDSSGCIGDKKIAYSKHFHHPYRKGDKFHRVAFVIMETALHSHYGLASEFAADEIALVTYSGGNRESRNLGIWNDCGILNLVRQFAKPAPQYNAYQRLLPLNFRADKLSGSVYSYNSFIHNLLYLYYLLHSDAVEHLARFPQDFLFALDTAVPHHELAVADKGFYAVAVGRINIIGEE